MTGRLIGIARREKPRIPMDEPSHATISLERGVEGDCRGATPDRQVTLLFREDWENACQDHGQILPWVTRRANLYVEGVQGFKRVGAQLQVGSVLLEVTEENPPCVVMDLQSQGLRVALQPEWRAGVACKVLTPGEVAIGDRVEVVDREARLSA